MSPTDPLERVVYISLPSELSETLPGAGPDLELEPEVPLPVELPPGQVSIDLDDITWEAVLAAMLKILAYNATHPNAEYYRRFVLATRPEIKAELTDAAIVKVRDSDFDLARELFMSLGALFPDSAATALNLALLYDEWAQQADLHDDEEAAANHRREALLGYRRALEIDPLCPDAHFNLAHFYTEQEEHAAARPHLEMYIKYGEDEDRVGRATALLNVIAVDGLADPHFQEAFRAIKAGREPEGIEQIQRFLRHHPRVWNAWFMLGWAHRRLKQYPEARDAFLKSLELSEPQSDTLNELAICYLELLDYAACQKCLHRALELEPENTKVISNLGILSAKLGRTEEALGFFRTTLEIDPQDPIARRYVSEHQGV